LFAGFSISIKISWLQSKAIHLYLCYQKQPCFDFLSIINHEFERFHHFVTNSMLSNQRPLHQRWNSNLIKKIVMKFADDDMPAWRFLCAWAYKKWRPRWEDPSESSFQKKKKKKKFVPKKKQATFAFFFSSRSRSGVWSILTNLKKSFKNIRFLNLWNTSYSWFSLFEDSHWMKKYKAKEHISPLKYKTTLDWIWF
jgi:hypothetical protein